MTNKENGEILTPPYLVGQESNRPIFAGIFGPNTLEYGQPFLAVFEASSPVLMNEVDRFTLVRLGATTHGNDMGQRYLSLGEPIAVNNFVGVATAPETPEEAPPGWYMLFAIGQNGVPSEAIYVRLQLP